MGNTKLIHDCKCFQEKLVEFLDGEIDLLDQKELLAELDQCNDCCDFLYKTKRLKNIVAINLERKCCGGQLIGDIRTQININPN